MIIAKWPQFDGKNQINVGLYMWKMNNTPAADWKYNWPKIEWWDMIPWKEYENGIFKHNRIHVVYIYWTML